MSNLKKDSRVVYYAEGQPYKGPFPAIVETVHPLEEGAGKGAREKLDLRVYFNGGDAPAHVKSSVPYSLEPAKHHWGDVPADWSWPENI